MRGAMYSEVACKVLRRSAGCAAVLAVALGAPSLAAAAEPEFSLLCPLFRQQEREDRRDLELRRDLAGENLAATQEILDLFDELLAKNAVRRLAHLGARHARDMARLEVEHIEIEIEREAAELTQYRIACAELPAGAGPPERDAALRRAHTLNRRADCDLQILQARRGAVDLAYRREVQESTRELRDRNAATIQEVIHANLQVKRVKAGLANAKRRTKACRAELDRKERPKEGGNVDPFGDA